ncbi:hypothetical protein [Achromobacter xylosoxidans]|uniref:hypothetical protein n=1 Tax=Alcaligenes xylosoxydans xylosoxydans TaxID=85698 RepID=UPI0009BAB636|nr:hypothetical protein [Achromobacter xylosoxidans]MCH1995317.1 hypothetical protein [Achromobacter xylosoxidans]
MKELLDWVESAANENLKMHHASADFLAKEAQTTLTVLLAGMAGAVAYGAKAVEQDSWGWLAAGSGAFGLYLLSISWLLVLKCMRIAPMPQIYNEPDNLFRPALGLEWVRERELSNKQYAINEAAARNRRVARWLNRVRLSAVLSPLVFIFASVAWVVFAG